MERLLSVLMALLLVMGCASAELVQPEPTASHEEETLSPEPLLTDGGLDLGIHSVHYPVLTGLADEALLEDVNSRILSAADVTALVSRLPLLLSSQTALTLTWEGQITGDVLTVTMSASGPVTDSRPTQVWSSVHIDLTTGADISLGDLFTDEEAAREALAVYMEETVAPELSGYLDQSDLLPLPDTWAISAEGITFLYPIDRLSTLSGSAGAVTVLWAELPGLTDLSDGGILARLGAREQLTLDESSAARIFAAAEKGELPGIPAVLGQSVQTLIDTWHELIDPDLCTAGRLISLEGAPFRGVRLITDDLSSSLEGSVVQGLYLDRGCLYGLIIGLTTRDAWRAALGEPSATLVLSGDDAEAWRLCEGVSDLYACGEQLLRLHADEEGVLRAIVVY